MKPVKLKENEWTRLGARIMANGIGFWIGRGENE
jgi:hypothetical protein